MAGKNPRQTIVAFASALAVGTACAESTAVSLDALGAAWSAAISSGSFD